VNKGTLMPTHKEGVLYYSVAQAAKSLSTSPTRIRSLMGSGELEWTQLRVNGQLMVPAESLLAFKRRHAR
jgi:hypothetical protein